MSASASDVTILPSGYAMYLRASQLDQTVAILGGLSSIRTCAQLAELLLVNLEHEEGRTGLDQSPNSSLAARRKQAIIAARGAFKPLTSEFEAPSPAAATLVADALAPLTSVHDEMLFIRVLQVFETVFSGAHAQLRRSRDDLAVGEFDAAAAHLQDAAQLLAASFPTFRVLATIQPHSFAVIRGQTAGASGLQSTSFKRIELIAAAPSPERLGSEGFAAPEVAAVVGTDEPTIEAVVRRRAAMRNRAVLYGLRAVDREWLRWKRTHWATATRVIGRVPGTGGTAGSDYLRAHMLTPLFPMLHRPGGVVATFEIPLSTTSASGPAERHLAETVTGALGRTASVKPCGRRAIADFVIEIEGLERDQGACSAAAKAVSSISDIELATAVPPRVYASLRLEALRAVVLGEQLSDEHPLLKGSSPRRKRVQVQFSCPNLNKALHLGHLRTNAIGVALANIAVASGYDVIRVDQPSSRGRHIVKAIFVYLGRGGTDSPEAAALKPDHFVGSLYAEFARRNGTSAPGERGPLDDELDALVQRLDAGDPELEAVAERLTRWAYDGITSTYARIGTRFDAVFPEGESVALARACIEGHIGDGAWRRPDGSVYVDLGRYGLRPVTIVRRHGGALLHTQFLGACIRRAQLDADSPLLFVMGQEYKDTVPELLGVLQELGHADFARRFEAVYHGMVRSPVGRLSSRRDALVVDDVLDSVVDRLHGRWARELGRPLDWHEADVCERISVALVKLHFLRPRRIRDVVWDEAELWNRTAPLLGSILATVASGASGAAAHAPTDGPEAERVRALLLSLDLFRRAVGIALDRRDPAELVRLVERIVGDASACQRVGALDTELSSGAALVVGRLLDLLGIHVPPFAADLPPTLRIT